MTVTGIALATLPGHPSERFGVSRVIGKRPSKLSSGPTPPTFTGPHHWACFPDQL